jgi:nicotinamidase-related amidase
MNKPATDLVDALKEFSDKGNTFTRAGYSGFLDKKFSNYLKRKKIKHLYLVGIDTENCVLSTAREAFDRGYRVTIFKNYCGSSHYPKLGEAALKIIKYNIGEVK